MQANQLGPTVHVSNFNHAAFFLPETKGKTLEEIEEHFEGKKAWHDRLLELVLRF